MASAPRTDVLVNIGNFTPNVLSQKSAILALLSGSCEKSLLGKPNTTKPRSLYLACRASRPLYCDVNPQKLAVLTTNTTCPAYWQSACGFSSCSLSMVCCSNLGHGTEAVLAETEGSVAANTKALLPKPKQSNKNGINSCFITASWLNMGDL